MMTANGRSCIVLAVITRSTLAILSRMDVTKSFASLVKAHSPQFGWWSAQGELKSTGRND